MSLALRITATLLLRQPPTAHEPVSLPPRPCGTRTHQPAPSPARSKQPTPPRKPPAYEPSVPSSKTISRTTSRDVSRTTSRSSMPSATGPRKGTAAPKTSSTVEGKDGESNKAAQAGTELTAAVDDLLSDLRKKFGAVSEEMVGRMDEMSKRLDELEGSLRKGEGASEGGK